MNEDEKMENSGQITKKQTLAVAKKVGFYVLFGIFVLLLVITVWVAVDKFIVQSPVPSFLGYSVLTIGSGSMEDTIMENDLILIKSAKEFEEGDVITFIREGDETPTTHRIVGFGDTAENFVTRGDANDANDTERVTKEEILGKMVLHLEGSALVMGWLINGGGAIFAILIVLILTVGICLIERSNGVVSGCAKNVSETDDRDESGI